ncbi:MAG: flagellar basal body P-ring formation chaperone FlgA, partial [Shewanella sp.]
MKVNLVYFLSIIALSIATKANAEPVVPSISAISELAKALINEKISVPSNAKVEILPQTIDSRLLPS